jgi:NADH:ubiquinone oxidoreductase subunit 4 (subunit M)
MWDILAFYVLFEACAVPLLLIISRGPGWHRFGGETSSWQAPLRHKLHAAYRLLCITVFGSLIVLPLLLLLSQEQGSSRFAHLWWVGTGAGTPTYAGALLWCGMALVFGIKLPLLPVHLWLPEAHVAAPTAGSVLLSGIFLKLGGYGFLFLSLPLCTVAHVYLNPILWVLAWLGFALGSLATLRQVDLKKVIAYSSIVHMALLPLALFSMSEVSLTGSFLLMLAHGLVSPALFVLAGQMFDRHHTEFLVYLASRGFLMPLWRTLFLFMSLANAGLPLFPDFIAEFLLLQSLFAVHPWPAFAICAMLVLPSAYSFWTYARLTFSLTRH